MLRIDRLNFDLKTVLGPDGDGFSICSYDPMAASMTQFDPARLKLVPWHAMIAEGILRPRFEGLDRATQCLVLASRPTFIDAASIATLVANPDAVPSMMKERATNQSPMIDGFRPFLVAGTVLRTKWDIETGRFFLIYCYWSGKKLETAYIRSGWVAEHGEIEVLVYG